MNNNNPYAQTSTLQWWQPAGPAALEELLTWRRMLHDSKKSLVTTNGCFDLLHAGHIQFLQAARALGDALVIGLNDDESTSRLKGPGRPFLPAVERAAMLAALRCVDHVVIFGGLLPLDFIELIKPDLHIKGGDYCAEKLPETETVQRNGGKVQILPLHGDWSTSALVHRLKTASESQAENARGGQSDGIPAVIESLLAGSNILRQTAYQLGEQIQRAADLLIGVLKAGHKILVCGNGGSAADAQHFAAELVVRYLHDRQALPALALTTDTSILTAVSNDTAFERAFARQVLAFGQPGDLLIALSTSGTSQNVLQAIEAASERGIPVIGFTGAKTSPMHSMVDLCLAIPSQYTPHIQQAHMAILHILCDKIEQAFLVS